MSRSLICPLLLSGVLVTGAVPAQAQNPKENKQPKPATATAITISKETTYLTKPLRKDGTLDYIAALNQRMGEGVTPQNNAAVLLWQAFGPHDVPEVFRSEFFKKLGIEVPRQEGHYFESSDDFLKRTVGDEDALLGDGGRTFYDRQESARRRPWTRREFPQIAAWLDANENPLNAIVAGVNRPKFFLPLVTNHDGLLLDAIGGIHWMDCRGAAEALCVRAMLSAGESRWAEARRDLLACHRFGRLIGQGPVLIDALAGIAVDVTASKGDQALTVAVNIPSEQLAAHRRDLQKLPPLPSIATFFDQGERLMALDAVTMVARLTEKELQKNFEKQFRTSPIIARLTDGRNVIDWNEILKQFNSDYDEIVGTLKKPTYAERIQSARALGKRPEEKSKKEIGAGRRLLSFIGGRDPAAMATEIAHDALRRTLLPSIAGAREAEIKQKAYFDMALITLALAEHRKAEGDYPLELSALVPRYLPEVPKDPFTDASLQYQKRESGYRLYSIGPNLKDESGRSYEDVPQGDDITVQVPVSRKQP